jgi:hypothetical protein
MSVDARYPVGRFQRPESIGAPELARYIEIIEAAPSQYRTVVEGLSSAQLDTPYREGGWTIRQVIHHVPDSHMNAYIRFKLALTENEPVIKPYDEAAWAQLRDAADTPVETSLTLLESLHNRWGVLMRSMSGPDWKKTYFHPEIKASVALETVAAMYAWHCGHHAAHIAELRKSRGW